MTPRRKRFAIALGVLAVVGGATALVLNAFQSNLVFFFSPSQIVATIWDGEKKKTKLL